MTALLLDEMISETVAEQLRARGIDTVAVVADESLAGVTDEDVLAYATEQQRLIVTLNIGDFATIASEWKAKGRSHAGIVYVTYNSFPQDRSFVGALVSALAAAYDAGRLPGANGELFLHRVAPT